MIKPIFLLITLIITVLIVVLAFILVIKYTKLTIKYQKLYKYLYNYLNLIVSARYGNLNSKCDMGVDALTVQLSKNTNALLESIIDRDKMINEYIEKQKQTQNLKQDFVSSLAHDLKVPIIAQDNTYDLFLNGNFGKITEDQRNAIKNLKVSNNDLKNLVVNLLDAHKIDTQEIDFNPEKINITNLILEVTEQNRSILKVKNKEIIFNKTENIFIKADAFLIKRAIVNLISNAIFYGKNSKNIYIDIEIKPSCTIISITDEGDGIKDDEINKLFQKYYSSSKKYSNIGVGLGLYIANKIADRHKGKLVAENTKDKGAKFSLYLPN